MRRTRSRNGFNTLVLGLLWLKILAFMKVVNRQMSTFIMALGQILKDLVYFSIVLLVVILMFADVSRMPVYNVACARTLSLITFPVPDKILFRTRPPIAL